MFLKGVWRVSGRCLKRVWKVSGRSLEGVWKAQIDIFGPGIYLLVSECCFNCVKSQKNKR